MQNSRMTKKLHKRLLKSKPVHYITVRILAFYIFFVYITARKTFDIHPLALPYQQEKLNGIFAFWHGRMMMIPPIHPRKLEMHVLISLHRDGMLISDVIRQFNLHTISGSSSKGGHAAIVEILRLLKEGQDVTITPDGPRGPNQVASPGIVSAAKLSGKPVLPVSFSASHHRRMASWDRFMLAYPFSRIIFCIGAPIMIDKSMDDEAARLLIESAMNALTEKADAAVL